MTRSMKVAAITLALAVGLLPGVARADPPLPAEARAAEPEGAAMRRIGWVTAGGGAAVLVASGVMYGVALREQDDLMDHGGPARGRSLKRDLTTAKILTVVGLVAVGTGVTLVLVAPTSNQQVRVTAGLGQIAIGSTF